MKTDMTDKLIDIVVAALNTALVQNNDSWINKGTGSGAVTKIIAIDTAKAVTELTLKQVLSLIGEDAPEIENKPGQEALYWRIIDRNELRAELRQSAERIWK